MNFKKITVFSALSLLLLFPMQVNSIPRSVALQVVSTDRDGSFNGSLNNDYVTIVMSKKKDTTNFSAPSSSASKTRPKYRRSQNYRNKKTHGKFKRRKIKRNYYNLRQFHCHKYNIKNGTCSRYLAFPKSTKSAIPVNSVVKQNNAAKRGESLLLNGTGGSSIMGAGLQMQPPTNSVIVNKDTYAYATRTRQSLTVAINEEKIRVDLHATNFSFNWADGTVTSATGPGRPWSKQLNGTTEGAITHKYTKVGDYQITLTTTWQGTFTTSDGVTRPLEGKATTVEKSRVFPVQLLLGYRVLTPETLHSR